MRRLRLYLDSSILGWSLNRGNPIRFAEANLLLQQIAGRRFFGGLLLDQYPGDRSCPTAHFQEAVGKS